MNLDIPTISLVAFVVECILLLALFVQWRLEKNLAGPGWWTVAIACNLLGFALTYLRAVPSLSLWGVFGNNNAFVISTVLYYSGTLRFFGKREPRAFILIFLAVFVPLDFYLTFINDDIVNRRTIFNLSCAAFSYLAAHAVFSNKTPGVATSANLLSISFFLYGTVFVISTILNVFSPPDAGPLIASFSQLNSLLGGLAATVLIVLSFILLINQRLSIESKEAKENTELVFNTSPDAILVTRLSDGYFTRINDGFIAMTGYTRADVTGKSSTGIHLWRDPAERAKFVNELQTQGTCENYEAVFVRKDGREFVGIVSAKILHLEGTSQILSVTRDITERKKIQELLQAQATRDELVGTFNRRHFMVLAENEIKRAGRLNHPLALALLDLDRFKQINDTYGHTAGDGALMAFVKICRANIREIDVLARFGGDEFVMLLPETTRAQAQEIVERVRVALASQALDLDGNQVKLTLSAGIAELASTTEPTDKLFQRADQALYQAKQAGRNRVFGGSDSA